MKLSIAIAGLLFLVGAADFDNSRFEKQVRASEIVVVAHVVEIRPSITTFWSGTSPCWQTVRYNVDQVLRGTVNDKVIDVGHLIVNGSLTAEKKNPVLSAVLFKPAIALYYCSLPKPKVCAPGWANLLLTSNAFARMTKIMVRC